MPKRHSNHHTMDLKESPLRLLILSNCTYIVKMTKELGLRIKKEKEK